MKFKVPRIFLAFISTIAISVTCSAEISVGSVSTGTGGTGRASVAPGDSVILNPAMLAHLRGYILYSGYQQGRGLFSISDNTKETVIPAAFTFYKQDQFQNMRLSVADFFLRNWSVGVSAHYSHYQKEQVQGNQWNTDVGFSYLASKNLGFGAVFYNLQGASDKIPLEYRPQRQYGLGMTYLYRSFLRLRFDAVSGMENDWDRHSLMGGLESNLNRWTLLRLGYREDRGLNQTYATAGLGLDYPRFQLNYAYEGELENQQNKRHSIDLAIPF